MHHTSSSPPPFHIVLSCSLVNLARVVVGLGLESLRLEFFSGDAVILISSNKQMASGIIMGLQQAYEQLTKHTLNIDNEDASRMHRIQTEVPARYEEGESYKECAIIKPMYISGCSSAQGTADGVIDVWKGVHQSTLQHNASSPYISSCYLLSSAVTLSHPRPPLSGVQSVLVVSEGYVWLCEELCLFDHCVKQQHKDTTSARHATLKRKQKQLSPLEATLHLWQQRLEKEKLPIETVAEARTADAAEEQRFHVLAVEPLQHLTHVDRSTLAPVDEHADGHKPVIGPFSACLTFHFGQRASVFDRAMPGTTPHNGHMHGVGDRQRSSSREWVVACSEDAARRITNVLKLKS